MSVVIKKLKIAILGSNGQLGQEFKHVGSTYEYFHIEFYSRQSLDITNREAILDLVVNGKFDYVINCAAYTAVDKAESDIDNCYLINTVACGYLAQAIKGTKTRLVHFSSDYVYHTYNGFPIKETDNTAPKGVYAKSKLEGEQLIRKSGIKALIIRTSWVISSYGHNFAKTMARLGAEKSELNVVDDQFGAPTYARHLALAVLDIITQVSQDNMYDKVFNDTYNYANEGIVTWYNIADRIMKEKNLRCIVHPINSADYPTPAARPKWSVLSKQKIKAAFGIEIPHWYSALKECLDNQNESL